MNSLQLQQQQKFFCSLAEKSNTSDVLFLLEQTESDITGRVAGDHLLGPELGGTHTTECVVTHGALACKQLTTLLSCTHRPGRCCCERSEDRAISQRAGIACPFFEVGIA